MSEWTDIILPDDVFARFRGNTCPRPLGKSEVMQTRALVVRFVAQSKKADSVESLLTRFWGYVVRTPWARQLQTQFKLPFFMSQSDIRHLSLDVFQDMVSLGHIVVQETQIRGRKWFRAILLRENGPYARSSEKRVMSYMGDLASKILPDGSNDERATVIDAFGIARRSGRPFATGNERAGLLVTGDPTIVRALLVPREVRLSSAGADILAATLFAFSPSGDLMSRLVGEAVGVGHIALTHTKEASFAVLSLDAKASLSRGIRLDVADMLTTVKTLLPKTSVIQKPVVWDADYEGFLSSRGIHCDRRAIGVFRKSLQGGLRTFDDSLWTGTLLYRLLDPDAVTAARKLPSATWDDYRWFCHPDPQVALWRRQAVAAYPMFAPLMMRRPDLMRLIDAGEPLAPALAGATGLLPAVLGKVGKQNWQRFGMRVALDMRISEEGDGAVFPKHAVILNACDVSRLPSRRAHWQTFIDAVDFLSLLGAFDVRRHPLLSDWTPMVRKLVAAWSNGWSRDAVAQTIARGIPDFRFGVSSVLEAALLPLLGDVVLPEERARQTKIPTDIANAMRSILIDGERPSFRDLRRRSADWHAHSVDLVRRMEAVRAVLSQGSPSAPSWQPLCRKFRLRGGTLQWLTDTRMLDEETRAMQHCVWSYTSACLLRGSHVASLVAGDGTRSTVEICVLPPDALHGGMDLIRSPDGWLLKVVQHKAHRNETPSPACIDLLSEALGKIPKFARFAFLEKELGKRRRKWGHTLIQRQGTVPFDPNDPAQCDAAWDIHREWALEPFRKLNRRQAADLVKDIVRAKDIGMLMREIPAHEPWDNIDEVLF